MGAHAALVAFMGLVVLHAEGRRHQAMRPLSMAETGVKPFPFASRNTTGIELNVLDFGALSSCNASIGADNTKAFQDAFGAASAKGGAVVVAPAGCYHFTGSLTIPEGVTLRGSYSYAPSHPMVSKLYVPTDGTVLMPKGFRGNESGSPFITMLADSSLRGLVVFYPEQEYEARPVPYPWAVSMVQANTMVTDVELLNPWNGISAVAAHRHYIARVQGQPLNIGVFIDSTYDIGRIEDVHFNPWFSARHPFVEYQLTHGRAFVMGRSDWEYVFNTFAFGYAVGYHFVKTATGTMNGNFLGIGADLAVNYSVLVDGSQPAGLLIDNGEFTAFHNKQWLPGATVKSRQVGVSASNSGPVKFVDSSFWGPSDQIALLSGTGTTTFSACQFVEWANQGDDSPAVSITAGNLQLQGNTFHIAKKQVDIAKGVGKVTVLGNIMNGPLRISGKDNAKNCQVGLNAYDEA